MLGLAKTIAVCARPDVDVTWRQDVDARGSESLSIYTTELFPSKAILPSMLTVEVSEIKVGSDRLITLFSWTTPVLASNL